jgi:hypothetical protein
MTDSMKYDFSYTGFSLRLKELLIYANTIKDNRKLSIQELGEGNSNTGKRRMNQVKKRYKALTVDQINLLILTDYVTQKQIAFLAICKIHHFIRDFVVDVLREKYLLFDYQIYEGEYVSFFNRKSELHPEMDILTDLTKNKVRQVTFKILEQVGLIDNVKTRIIQPQFLDDVLVHVIVKDDRNLLKLFLWSDIDIENTSTQYGKPNQ